MHKLYVIFVSPTFGFCYDKVNLYYSRKTSLQILMSTQETFILLLLMSRNTDLTWNMSLITNIVAYMDVNLIKTYIYWCLHKKHLHYIYWCLLKKPFVYTRNTYITYIYVYTKNTYITYIDVYSRKLMSTQETLILHTLMSI